jgi:hypothetical protein
VTGAADENPFSGEWFSFCQRVVLVRNLRLLRRRSVGAIDFAQDLFSAALQ